jgi:hypothetical protein
MGHLARTPLSVKYFLKTITTNEILHERAELEKQHYRKNEITYYCSEVDSGEELMITDGKK